MATDPQYFSTTPGILKILQMAFAIVCIPCALPILDWRVKFFVIVVGVFLGITFVFCVIYFFALQKLYRKVPWLIIELALTVVAMALYIAVTVLMLLFTTQNRVALQTFDCYDYYIVAGSFGALNAAAYALGAIHLFQEWK